MTYDLELLDKVVIVTGGSRGIGRAITSAFLDAGARVRMVARNADRLRHSADELGPRCSWAAADVSDGDAARSVIAATVDELGAVDVLVNNAGYGLALRPLAELDASRAARAALVNQWAPVLWSTAVWEAWQSTHGGAIVNIASVGGVVPWPNGAYYGATKAALIHLTRHLALELSPRVRVNAVAPGLIETDMTRGVVDERDRRVGRPEEVADIVVFLGSARASLINGTTLIAADPRSFVVSA